MFMCQKVVDILVSLLVDNSYIYNLYIVQFNIVYVLDIFGGMCCQIEMGWVQVEVQCFQCNVIYLMLVFNVVLVVVNEVVLCEQLQVVEQVVVFVVWQLDLVCQ